MTDEIEEAELINTKIPWLNYQVKVRLDPER